MRYRRQLPRFPGMDESPDSAACEFSPQAALSPEERQRFQDPAGIRRIFADVKTIAVVGLSRDPGKPSHYVPAHMQRAGYRIIPVTPHAGTVLGETDLARSRQRAGAGGPGAGVPSGAAVPEGGRAGDRGRGAADLVPAAHPRGGGSTTRRGSGAGGGGGPVHDGRAPDIRWFAGLTPPECLRAVEKATYRVNWSPRTGRSAVR